MILIHVVHVYAMPGIEQSVFGYIVEFIGGPPAAPAFMMLMGIFFVYSNKGSLRKSVFRGLNILLAAVALNLVRGIIPYFMLTELQGASPVVLGAYFRMEYLIFEVDILTFAGVAYIIMALFYRIAKKPVFWLAAAVLIAIGSPLLWQIEITNKPLQYITNVFWGEEYLSTFPLFPWLAFPLVGMAIGRLLKQSSDINKTINKLGLASVFLLASGVLLMLINFDYFYNAYGEMGLGAIIAIIGFVMFWQWLINKLYKAVKTKVKTGILHFLSRNVLEVYFIHWVFCKWGVVIFGIDSLGYFGIAAMFVSVTTLTMMVTWAYTALKKGIYSKRGNALE